MHSASLLPLICFLFNSLPTELGLRSRLSPTECIRRLCSLSFAFCLTIFRLNCGFVAGFPRLNTFSFTACSHLLMFISSLSVLLPLSLPGAFSVSLQAELRLRNRLTPTECAFCLTPFRPNCGFVAGFLRLNIFGSIAPSHLLSLNLSPD
jgi:hypothetical protein